MARQFNIDGRLQADPDPNMTVEQVRNFYSEFFRELTNATISGPSHQGEDEIYTFEKKVGVKADKSATLTDLIVKIKSDPSLERIVAAFLENVDMKLNCVMVYDGSRITLTGRANAAICGSVKIL
jgi:PRTRC genetic system protein C